MRSKPILRALSSPSVIFPADPPVSLDRIEGLGSNCGHSHWFQENSQKPSCIRIKRMNSINIEYCLTTRDLNPARSINVSIKSSSESEENIT